MDQAYETVDDISNSNHDKVLLPLMVMISKGKENDRFINICGSLYYGDWF